MVCWMIIFLQKALNVSAMKFVPISKTVFFGSPYFAICTRSSANRLFTFFTVGNLDVVIYNAQKSFCINPKNICTNHSPWPASYFRMLCFSWGFVCWYCKHMAHCLTVHSMSAFIWIQYTVSFTRSHVSSIPILLLCNWSNVCFCNIKGIIIHLHFITTSLIIARSFLIGQQVPKLGFISSLYEAILLLCVPVTFAVLHIYSLQLSMCRLEWLQLSLLCVYLCWNLVPVFCVVVMGQPICYIYIGPD